MSILCLTIRYLREDLAPHIQEYYASMPETYPDFKGGWQPHQGFSMNGKSTTPTQSIRQNYTSVYSFACDVVAMPKHRYCVEQPPSMAVYAMLNVPHGMGYPARMPVVPNRNEFFALQKTRSQKCTRMYIFDEVVASGLIPFLTLLMCALTLCL